MGRKMLVIWIYFDSTVRYHYKSESYGQTSVGTEFDFDMHCGYSKTLMKTNESGISICPLKPNSVWGIVLTFILDTFT